MVENYLSVVNVDTIKNILAITFLIALFIGITDFQKNIEKIGE